MKKISLKNKIVVFGDNRLLKVLKIVSLCFCGILLLWFTFDMTGLKLGNTKFVTSAFIDEPIDFVFYLIYSGCIVLFILKDKIGQYVLSVFLFIWGLIQFSMYSYSGEKIISYNNFFADTHHIIEASRDILVKDTYHIFLDIFILSAFISVLTFMITQIIFYIKKRKNQNSVENQEKTL